MRTKLLLVSLASAYHTETMDFSRKEIKAKIEKIKYLASQKRVPKLSLRKEILHLEQKLENIVKLEKEIKEQKTKESKKIKTLKKKIKNLQKRLAAAGDKDLQKKVQKISHLIGENLAQKEVYKNVQFAKMQLNSNNNQDRVSYLKEKIEILKEKISLVQDPEESSKLKIKLKEIENKLYGEEQFSVKHKLILSGPEKKTIAQSLPLPPPPRIVS